MDTTKKSGVAFKTDIYDAYNLDRLVTVVVQKPKEEPRKLYGSIWTFGGTGFILEGSGGKKETLRYEEISYFDSFDRIDI